MQLEAKNVGFYYKRNHWLFRNVNVQINPGEIVGLVGPSGSGKTTLSKVLAGYEKPKEGRVTLGGDSLRKKDYQPVQLVYQHPEKAVNTKWRMDDILKEGRPQNRDKDFLDPFGIQEEWLRRWPNELSGGELQRFCVARALGPKTQFLIADEMTTMLDAITQAQIWHAVLNIAKKRQLGILVISHEQHLVKKICSRIIRL